MRFLGQIVEVLRAEYGVDTALESAHLSVGRVDFNSEESQAVPCRVEIRLVSRNPINVFGNQNIKCTRAGIAHKLLPAKPASRSSRSATARMAAAVRPGPIFCGTPLERASAIAAFADDDGELRRDGVWCRHPLFPCFAG